METTKTIKEFWVRLICHENDAYIELWRTKGKQYIARYTYDREGVWYSVSDPMGYCELVSPLPEHFVFHVCDSRFRELHVSSNGDGKDFPCLRVLCEDKWEKCQNAISHGQEQFISKDSSMQLKGWLLSFKDPEVYGEVAQGYDENWCGRVTTLGEEVLSSFQYVGETYQITKVRQQHTVCHAEWVKYYVAGQCVGAEFDAATVGTMYSENEAVDKVVQSLKEIHKGAYSLSYVEECHGEQFEHNLSFYAAAKHHLLCNNYNRNHVDSIIEHEQIDCTFFASPDDILAKYPNYLRDPVRVW